MDELTKYVKLIREQYEVIMAKIYNGEYDPAETYTALLKLNNCNWLSVDRRDAETIILVTSIALNVPYETMQNGSRMPEITEARRISIYFVRKILGLSQRKIATIFKLNDHKTIKYHLDMADSLILCDVDFCDKIEKVKNMLRLSKANWII